MEKMANLLGKPDDARKYQELAARIKQAFNRTFWNPSTRTYDRNSQAANAVALYMGLTTPENRQQVFDNLIADIRGRNNALTAGDVGYRYVLRALEAGGASDVIYDMNCKYDTPGYGWQLAHGATALIRILAGIRLRIEQSFYVGSSDGMVVQRLRRHPSERRFLRV